MKKMTGKLLAASPALCSDILYAGGFHAPDEVVYFEIPGTKGLILSTLEYARGKAFARKGVQVLRREDFFSKEDSIRSTPTLLGNLSRFLKMEHWKVPADFPLLYADTLRSFGIEVEPVAGTFFPNRMKKTVSEVKKIEHAMHWTQESMSFARDMIRKATVNSRGFLSLGGSLLTSERLRSGIEGFLKNAGYTASQTITACGTDASQPHNVGHGPLQTGKPIVVDIFPRSDETGYWGDMTRTFCKGIPEPVVERAFRAVLAASETAEKMVRPGEKGAQIHLAAAEVLASAGFPTGHTADGSPCGFIHGLGHGVGLDIHEAPRISPAADVTLSPGYVFSNEPGLYHPAWGGIRLEDVLVVTPEGSRNFYTMEKVLVV